MSLNGYITKKGIVMALIVSNHSVVINLPAVFRDIGFTAAECKNEIECGILSSSDDASKVYRKEELLKNMNTGCDGYLLVYNCASKREKAEFVEKLALLGLQRGVHVAHGYCVWICEFEIDTVYKGDEFLALAVSHVDDPSSNFEEDFPVLSVSNEERTQLDGLKVVSARVKSVVISGEYIAYQRQGVFSDMWYAIKSLFATRGEHTFHYEPPEYEFLSRPISGLNLGVPVLPGVSDVVPDEEIMSCADLDVKPEYMMAFTQGSL